MVDIQMSVVSQYAGYRDPRDAFDHMCRQGVLIVGEEVAFSIYQKIAGDLQDIRGHKIHGEACHKFIVQQRYAVVPHGVSPPPHCEGLSLCPGSEEMDR